MAFGDILESIGLDSDSGSTISGSFSSVAAGNLLVYTVMTFASNSTAGTGLTEAVENVHAANGDVSAIYYRRLVGGDSTGPWQVTLAEADQYAAILHEIDGGTNGFDATPLDQTGVSDTEDTYTMAVTAGGATSQAVEFVIACWGVRDINADADPVSVDNSFVNLGVEHNSDGFNWHLYCARATKVLSATGTPTVTLTNDGSNSNGVDGTNCIATFKEASGGGGPTVGEIMAAISSVSRHHTVQSKRKAVASGMTPPSNVRR